MVFHPPVALRACALAPPAHPFPELINRYRLLPRVKRVPSWLINFGVNAGCESRRSTAQLRVEPGGLPGEVVPFGEAGRRPGSFGVEPGSGRRVSVTFV